MKVPPQNIISTNESDVWIENHIGRENNSPSGAITNKHGLVDHFIERGEPSAGTRYSHQQIDGKSQYVKTPRLNAFQFLKTPAEI